MSFVDNPHSGGWTKSLADDRGLSGRIAEGVRVAILDGTLKPGQKINEEELSGGFATSRTPVREALRLLEAEGLVTAIPRRGVWVTELFPEEAADTYLCRAYLYGLAAKLAALRRADADVAVLNRLMADLADVADRASYLDVMARLNAAIVAASGSPQIREQLKPLDLKAVRYRHVSVTLPHRMDQSRDNYRRIVEAIDRRQPEAAEQAGRFAIADAGEALLAHVGAGKPLTIKGLI